ncbi:MAG: integrase [Lachnospiraceae bacterium]|nr:integrase [Lachnospiraceae bacterium]
MPKRKRFPRLPNKYGSIRYLGENRRNCYAVHPPALKKDEQGRYLRPPALCYVDDWYVGFAVLNAYHAGTYKPGDELQFKTYRDASEADLDAFCSRILADFTAQLHKNEKDKNKTEDTLTFSEVYELFFTWKYGDKAAKKLSKQSAHSARTAFHNCHALHDRPFRDITLAELQKCLDDCPLKKASLENIMNLLKQMYKFAEPRDLCNRNYAQYLMLPDAEDDEHGIPFSDEELAILWQHKTDVNAELALIMCYSGFRISAYAKMEVNITDWYFKGGVKTAASKNRIVPIHSAIQPLVVDCLKRNGGRLVTVSNDTIRNGLYKVLETLGIARHTPHDCRHTFSRLCEKYSVSESDRKRMLGHSFGSDITNGVYGHRTVEDLRSEIEKIKVPVCD